MHIQSQQQFLYPTKSAPVRASTCWDALKRERERERERERSAHTFSAAPSGARLVKGHRSEPPEALPDPIGTQTTLPATILAQHPNPWYSGGKSYHSRRTPKPEPPICAQKLLPAPIHAQFLCCYVLQESRHKRNFLWALWQGMCPMWASFLHQNPNSREIFVSILNPFTYLLLGRSIMHIISILVA